MGEMHIVNNVCLQYTVVEIRHIPNINHVILFGGGGGKGEYMWTRGWEKVSRPGVSRWGN